MVARINWADPITRGLKFAAVLHSPQRAEDLTKGLRPVASDGNGLAGGPTFAVDSEGPHVFHPDEQAHYLHYGPHTDYDVTTQATWLFRFRIPSSTSINADIFAKGRYYTSGKAWAFQYQTDNSFRLTVETNFYDIFTGTPALDTDVLTTVGLTYDKDGGTNNLKTYRDGEYNRGHTTSAITIPTTSDPITLGGNDNGDGAFPIHYYFAYLWNRVLTAEEIARLQRDPYCFLISAPALPTEEALAYPAAAPAGAAISGSSAGVATASGALTADGALAGSSAGAATTTGTLAAPGDIVGSSSGAATTSGALTGSAAAAGSSAGAATTAGAVTGAGALTGSSAGAATPTATLTGAGSMAAAAAGTATVSGACDGFSACEGAAAGTATTSGAIAGTAAAVGTSAGAAAGSATILGAGALAGAAAGVATVFGVFEGTVVDIASGPVLTCAIPADAELACRIPDDPTLNLRC